MEKISPSSRPTADIRQNNGVDDKNEDEQQGDPSRETDYRCLIQVLLQGMGGTRMEIDLQQPAGKQYAEEEDVAGAESAPEGIAKIYLVLWVAKVLGEFSPPERIFIQGESAGKGIPWTLFNC